MISVMKRRKWRGINEIISVFSHRFLSKVFLLFPGFLSRKIAAFILAQTISTTTSAPVMLLIHWWCVGKMFLPIQTSPKQPCPSFRSRRRDSLGISQASLASPWVWGLATGHTSVRAWHSPSECSETEEKQARGKGWVGAEGERRSHRGYRVSKYSLR